MQPACPVCPDCPVPKELDKTSLPTYVVEPPDILLIDAVRLVPRPPYRVEPQDALLIQVANVLPTEPIAGLYLVDPDGTVNLGLSYGSVRVVGMTLEEAKEAIERHLRVNFKDPQAAVALGQSRGLQQIRGEHLVRPDGTVNLGTYGNVYVAGRTLPEAKALIEAHLTQFLSDPEISIDVAGYNSKVYYVITDGGGLGESVIRLPITGNETVLDAISQVNGLPPVASKKRIWIARPAPSQMCCEQILAVDWKAITQKGLTATNYQLLPGDRLYVHSHTLVALDVAMSRIIAPFERLSGAIFLGSGVVRTLAQPINNFGFFGGFGTGF
jgi:polysaccharide export outer membrane protein